MLQGAIELAQREGEIGTALRAINNVVGNVFNELGVGVANQLARDGLEMARAIGDVSQTAWILNSLLVGTAFAAEPAAPVLAQAYEFAARDLERTDRREIDAGLLFLGALVGNDTTTLEAEAQTLFDDADDPQAATDLEFWRIFVALAAGDFKTSAARAAHATEMKPSFGVMGMAALLEAVAGDYEACRRDCEKLDSLPVIGKWDAVTRAAARDAVAIVEGNRDQGGRVLGEALADIRGLGDLVTASIVAMAMVRLLGADHPEARAAAEQSIADFERMGAPPMVKLISDVLAEDGPASPRNAPPKRDATAPVGA
jgi:hypothetical protein